MSVINTKKLLYRNYRQEITNDNDIKGLEVGKFERPDFYVEYEIESGNKKVKLTVISGTISGNRTYTYKSSGNAESEVFASVTNDNRVLVNISGMKSKTVNISSNVISGDIDWLTASNYTEDITDGSAPFEEFYKKYTLKATDSIGVEADEVSITGKTTIEKGTSAVTVDSNEVKLDVNGSTATINNTGVEINKNLNVTDKVTTNTFESISNSEVGGTLDVDGKIIGGSGLSITGETTLDGKTTIKDNLNVSKGGLDVTGKTILSDGNASFKVGDTSNEISLTAKDIDLNGETEITGNTKINGTLNTTGDIKTENDFEGDQVTAERLITKLIMPNHEDKDDDIYVPAEDDGDDSQITDRRIVIGKSVEYGDDKKEIITKRGTVTYIRGKLELDDEDIEFRGITRYDKVEIGGDYIPGDRPLQVYSVSKENELFNIELVDTDNNFKTTIGTDLIVNGNMTLGTKANKATLTYTADTARTYTIPNAEADAEFVMSAGDQTIKGNKTFNDGIIIPGQNKYIDLGNKNNWFWTRFSGENWTFNNTFTGGSWARNLMEMRSADPEEDAYFRIGALGSGQTFNHMYIGPAFDDYWFSLNSDRVIINNELHMQSNKITKLATPTDDTDAANKSYVDNWLTKDKIDTVLKGLGDYSIQLGQIASASGNKSTALGYYAQAAGRDSTSIGHSASASGNISTALGMSASASETASTALGYNASAPAIYSTALGSEASASGNFSTALGWEASASGNLSTALGHATNSTGISSIALGYGAKAEGENSIAIGRDTEVTEDNVVDFGSTRYVRVNEKPEDDRDAVSKKYLDDTTVRLSGEQTIKGNKTFEDNTVITKDLTVDGDLIVNGSTTTISTTNLLVKDKNIELGVGDTMDDSTASGGGITLRGSTDGSNDKTILWDATNGWKSSEKITASEGFVGDLDGSASKLNGQEGSYYLNASNINAGTLAIARGGTNITTYTKGDILYASDTNTLSKLTKGSDGQVLKLASGLPSWGTDNNTATAADDILDGSNIGTQIKYSPYTVAEAGKLSSVVPKTGTTNTLGYSGYFYTNGLFAPSLYGETKAGGDLTIGSTSSPTKGTITLDSNTSISGNLTLGTEANKVTLRYVANIPRTYTIPNVEANAIFVMNEGDQTIGGIKKFTAIPAFNGGTTNSTAPFTVDSTFLVTNLNADLLDGQHGSYYRNADNINAGTLKIARGGTNITTYTAGDILYASATNTLAKLSRGSNGQVLKLVNGFPAWSADNDRNTNLSITKSTTTNTIVSSTGNNAIITAATPGEAGLVTTTSQEFAGTKKFAATAVFDKNIDIDGNLNFTSDERMKSKHFKFDDKDMLKKLSTVDIYEYNFLNKPDETKIGLMAQDLQESFPELDLVENKGYDEEYDLKDSLAIRHNKLTYVLWSALKGANERIDELEERLSKLEELINKE